MTVRETAIKGLECCVLHNPDDKPRCDECPYKYPLDSNCVNRLKYEALNVLKKASVHNSNQKLPCKCGRIRTRTGSGSGAFYGMCYVKCPGCGLEVYGKTEQEAIDNWNKAVKKDGQ